MAAAVVSWGPNLTDTIQTLPTHLPWLPCRKHPGPNSTKMCHFQHDSNNLPAHKLLHLSNWVNPKNMQVEKRETFCWRTYIFKHWPVHFKTPQHKHKPSWPYNCCLSCWMDNKIPAVNSGVAKAAWGTAFIAPPWGLLLGTGTTGNSGKGSDTLPSWPHFNVFSWGTCECLIPPTAFSPSRSPPYAASPWCFT